MFIAQETNTCQRRSEERKEGACLRATCIPLIRRRRRERLLRAINMRTPDGVETACAVGPGHQNSMSFHLVAANSRAVLQRFAHATPNKGYSPASPLLAPLDCAPDRIHPPNKLLQAKSKSLSKSFPLLIANPLMKTC